MRTRRSPWTMGLAVVAAALAGEARGQGMAAGGANPITNPYMNPYMNPYLNPSLSGGSVARNDALLYMWTAQQQPGGLLAGGATGASASRRGTGTSRAAEIPRTAMQPGSGASRFFNPGRAAMADNPSRRYQRTNRYFGSNGR